MNHFSRKLHGHEKLLSSLLGEFFNKKISNSIIFSGNKGIGKATFCFYLINEIYKNIDSNYNEITSSNHIYNNTHTNIRHITKVYDDKLKKRKNYNPKLLNKFKNIQLSLDYKKKRSQFVIKNDFTNKSVNKSIEKILKDIL